MSLDKPQGCHLDELGYYFVRKCIKTIESRGLDDQGLYRVGGVNSRVNRLLQMCLDRKNYDPNTGRITMPDFRDPVEWETKTITSALKNYLRNLSEPLMTYNLHPSIIEASKIEDPQLRTNLIKSLIQQLPAANFNLLKILVEHLKNVASHSQKNLMTVSNLGICFAPTLMRRPEENAASIMEIKYSNVVANTLIEGYDSIFNDVKLNQPMQLCNQNNQSQKQSRYNSVPPPPPPLTATAPPLPPPPPLMTTNSTITNNNNNNNGHNHHHLHHPHLSQQHPHHPPHDDQFGLSLPPSHHPHYADYLENHTFNAQPTTMTTYSYYNLPPYTTTSDKVITLYACVADTESELSFGPNEVIKDVRYSAEVGWLVGTLERNGQRGLLPENYVKFI